MIQKDQLSEIHQYAIRNIECRVRGLIGRYGITPDDREDLIQQLFLEYLERQDGFDPGRGRYKTFVNCLVRNQVASLVRARKSQLREATVFALPSPPEDDSEEDTDASGAGEISEDDYRMATGQASRPAAELLGLRIDVDRALESLPPRLREIGNRVVEEGVADLSKALGRSQSRIYQLLWNMRPAFAALGVMPAAGGAR